LSSLFAHPIPVSSVFVPKLRDNNGPCHAYARSVLAPPDASLIENAHNRTKGDPLLDSDTRPTFPNINKIASTMAENTNVRTYTCVTCRDENTDASSYSAGGHRVCADCATSYMVPIFLDAAIRGSLPPQARRNHAAEPGRLHGPAAFGLCARASLQEVRVRNAE